MSKVRKTLEKLNQEYWQVQVKISEELEKEGINYPVNPEGIAIVELMKVGTAEELAEELLKDMPDTKEQDYDDFMKLFVFGKCSRHIQMADPKTPEQFASIRNEQDKSQHTKVEYLTPHEIMERYSDVLSEEQKEQLKSKLK